MTNAINWRIVGAILLFSLATALPTPAQTFSVLYDFGTNNGDPARPDYPSVISQGVDGYLYSTTPQGGLYDNGAVFKISPTGDLTVLHSFKGGSDGGSPFSGLTLGGNGNLYGTTISGGAAECALSSFGCGTLFEITPSGILNTLWSFTGGADGAGPLTPPTEGVDGNLYGTTSDGAQNRNGTIYRITPSGVLTTLHQFSGTEGTEPSPLTQATDGNFYGFAYGPGGFPPSVLFTVTPSGKFSALHVFKGLSCGALVEASDGNLYTACGGQDVAVLLRVTVSRQITVLRRFPQNSFPGTDLMQGTDGNLYGTAKGGRAPHGAVYRISLDGTEVSVLHVFDGTDGDSPTSALAQHTNGSFFGVTFGGGSGTACDDPACGVFYGLSVGLQPFVRLSLPAGKVGQTRGILGQDFTGTTAVAFNGVPANYTVVSDTVIRVTIPPGATTGFVTVTTPGGVLTSNAQFHVLR